MTLRERCQSVLAGARTAGPGHEERVSRWRRVRQAVLARRGEDGGFGVIEVVMAFSILTLVLIGTEVGAVDAMNTARAVQQHSVAASLIAAAASEAEALPFSTLQAGLDPTADPLTGDPNVSSITSSGTTTYHLTLSGGIIAACGTTSPAAPLVPHIAAVTVGVTYHVAAYPTVASATCGTNPALVTLVVVVTWPSATGGTGRLVGVTEVAAP